MNPEHSDDRIARRLAQSGIRLGEDDLRYLRGAVVALDAARTAVTRGAQEIRAQDGRHWPLPPRGDT